MSKSDREKLKADMALHGSARAFGSGPGNPDHPLAFFAEKCWEEKKKGFNAFNYLFFKT